MQKNSSPAKPGGLLAALTSARSGPLLLCLGMLVAYCLLPLIIDAASSGTVRFGILATMTTVSVLAVLAGALTPVLDPWTSGRLPRLAVGSGTFNAAVWTPFLLFACVAWATAPEIPLIAALSGADPNEIAILREQFLKAREGWQASFVYINAIFSGALLPYSLALMFLHGMRVRWLAAGFFFLFCISFLEKVFFFKIALPMLYLILQGKAHTRLSPRMMVLGMCAILAAVTVFSGSGQLGAIQGDGFFSVTYVPEGGLAHLLWRSVAIPMVTAADAIRVLAEHFNDQPLLGATSSFLAGMFGMERIEYERMVFAAQWGQNETGTGSANSVFFTEAFVNFGWLGVILFSYVVGLLMRMFAVSRDEAFKALWLLFAFGVYTSGLIGMLLSNGFILLFIMALFVRIRVRTSRGRSFLPAMRPSSSTQNQN